MSNIILIIVGIAIDILLITTCFIVRDSLYALVVVTYIILDIIRIWKIVKYMKGKKKVK